MAETHEMATAESYLISDTTCNTNIIEAHMIRVSEKTTWIRVATFRPAKHLNISTNPFGELQSK